MSPKLLVNQVEKQRRRPTLEAHGAVLLPRRIPVGMGLLAILTLVPGLAMAGPGKSGRNRLATRPAVNVISNLSWSESGDTTVIQVDAATRPVFTVYKLERPARLTVDLTNATIRDIKSLTDVESWVVSQVATTHFRTNGRSVARVMVNFRRPSHYTVKARGTRVVITITPNKRRKAGDGEAQLKAELAQMQEELKQQKQVASAAVEAATHLRQVAIQARQRLASLSGNQRQEALQDLKQAETRLRQAELARKKADVERDRLQQALRQALKRTGELERKIDRERGMIRDIRFVEDRQAARIEIELDRAGIPAHRVAGQAGQPVLELTGVKLPQLLERTLDTTEFGGPVKQVTSYHQQGKVAIRVNLQHHAEGHLEQVDRTLVWSFPKSGYHGSGTGTVGGRASKDYTYNSTRVAAARVKRRSHRRRTYSGRRIDLDFKDADLHNILRLLSEVGNVNIVTSDKVSGRVTIRMKNVPWDHALDVILRAKQLGQVREGNLVRVAPAADLEKEREAEIARQKQILLLRPLETRLIR